MDRNTLKNALYGKSTASAYDDVQIRATALELAVKSFDVCDSNNTATIGGRASIFEAYLRGGIPAVHNLGREHDERVNRQNGRITKLENALYTIGTAFGAWEDGVREKDGLFLSQMDLSEVNKDFHAVMQQVLADTPMPHEVREDDRYDAIPIGSPEQLFDILNKAFGSTIDIDKVRESVPDCGDPECLTHKKGGLLNMFTSFVNPTETGR